MLDGKIMRQPPKQSDLEAREHPNQRKVDMLAAALFCHPAWILHHVTRSQGTKSLFWMAK